EMAPACVRSHFRNRVKIQYLDRDGAKIVDDRASAAVGTVHTIGQQQEVGMPIASNTGSRKLPDSFYVLNDHIALAPYGNCYDRRPRLALYPPDSVTAQRDLLDGLCQRFAQRPRL